MTLFENFVVTTIIAGLVGVLFGLWRDKRFAEFKNDIEQRAFEHRTRFLSLHEKRAEIIAQLYQKITLAQRLIKHASFPLPIPFDDDKRHREAFQAYLDFEYFSDENRIYFTKKQCEILDALEKLTGLGALSTRAHQGDLTDESKKYAKVQLKEALEGIPPLQESLEDTFRELLGIELEENRELTPAQ